jgi:hypothetical protein
MFRRVEWDVVRIRLRDLCDDRDDWNTWRRVFGDRAAEATQTKGADALGTLRGARPRGSLLLVSAPVRTADAVDRVQRREYDQHQDRRESAHPPIICAARARYSLTRPIPLKHPWSGGCGPSAIGRPSVPRFDRRQRRRLRGLDADARGAHGVLRRRRSLPDAQRRVARSGLAPWVESG